MTNVMPSLAANLRLQTLLRIGSLCAVAVLTFAGRSHADYAVGEAKLSGRTMGTTWHATVDYNAHDVSEGMVQDFIDERLVEINKRMSTYDPESELSRFNSSETTDWFTVSEETAKVVASALDTAKRTDGQFDPTIGPLVNLWGFGPDGRRKEPPSEEDIAAAKARMGYAKVEVRLDPPALRKSQADVYLDLSAIAKGYAADAVAEMLYDAAQSNYVMVEIGGEIRTLGVKTSGDPWRIGIERPNSNARMISHVVEIKNGDAIATSGDYRNYFKTKGQRYSHTIDPATSRPVTHNLATVSVRCPTCMEADALATALSVMGPEKGYTWATDHDIAAIFVERTEQGFREQVTPAWKKLDTSFEAQAAPKSPTTTAQEPEKGNMLTYLVITIVVFVLAITGMAIGVIVSNRRIKGTCGGIANLQGSDGKTACELCSNPSPTCTGNPEQREPVEAS